MHSYFVLVSIQYLEQLVGGWVRRAASPKNILGYKYFVSCEFCYGKFLCRSSGSLLSLDFEKGTEIIG